MSPRKAPDNKGPLEVYAVVSFPATRYMRGAWSRYSPAVLRFLVPRTHYNHLSAQEALKRGEEYASASLTLRSLLKEALGGDEGPILDVIVLHMGPDERGARRALREHEKKTARREFYACWFALKPVLAAESEIELLEACEAAGVDDPASLTNDELLDLMDGHVNIAAVQARYEVSRMDTTMFRRDVAERQGDGWYLFYVVSQTGEKLGRIPSVETHVKRPLEEAAASYAKGPWYDPDLLEEKSLELMEMTTLPPPRKGPLEGAEVLVAGLNEDRS